MNGQSTWCRLLAFVLTLTVILVVVFNHPFYHSDAETIAKGGDLDERNSTESFQGKGLLVFKRRLPKCILFGVRKSGTQALVDFLNIHPSIKITKGELHFFDNEINYNRGIEWYRKQMPCSFDSQITIERTPGYFAYDLAPERIFKMNSSIKLLLIVREPTERAISNYLHLKSNKKVPSFEDLILSPDTGEVNPQKNIIGMSIYEERLSNWLKYFPREKIHVVDGQMLVEDPLSAVRKVETFLNLDHKISSKNIYYNKTRGFFCMRRQKLKKCLSDMKGRKHPDIDPDVKRKLQEFYRPHNEKLFKLISQRFDWS